FCEVEREGVAASVGVSVAEADGRVPGRAAECGQDAGGGDGVGVADEGVARVGGRAAAASFEAEPRRREGVQNAPGGAAEVAFGAHELIAALAGGELLGQPGEWGVEEVCVQGPADVGGCGGDEGPADLKTFVVRTGEGGLADRKG